MLVTTARSLAICTDSRVLMKKVEALLPFFVASMEKNEINTPERQSAFLAQVGHESGGLLWFKEIWGPTEAQKHYDPPWPKAAELGNTDPGDGKKYMGRGPIQITGKSNYARYGKIMGLDLVNSPQLLEDYDNGVEVSSIFWRENGLNDLADVNSDKAFLTITRKINGGTNGLTERIRIWRLAKAHLGVQ